MSVSDSRSGLWPIVWSGNPEDIRRTLERGADPNGRDPETTLTPLMVAAGIGSLESVEILLSAGADVRALDGLAGATALHKACQGGRLEVARRLLQAGASVNVHAVSTGHTPLMEAVWFTSAEIVELLLSHHARTDITLRTNYGFTLDDHVNYALKVNTAGDVSRRLARIRDLIAEKRDRDRQLAELPIFQALFNRDLAALRVELSRGADTEVRYPIVGTFSDGHTPLLIAARDGDIDLVRELIGAGADVNAIEPVFCAVPLHKATYNGYLEITRMLTSTPGIHLDYQGPMNGYTPLHDALWHGFADCAEVLIRAGARTDLIAYDGKRPLDIALDVLGADHPITGELRTKAVAS